MNGDQFIIHIQRMRCRIANTLKPINLGKRTYQPAKRPVFAGIMRASGTVLLPMLISVGCIVLIELPCAVLFSHWYGLQGIWFAYALAFTMMCIIQTAYYQFVWKKKTVQRLI